MKMKFKKPYIEPLPKGMTIENPHALISTWFGCGLIRPAPGTIGSLAAIPFGYAINYYTHPAFLLLAALILFIASAYSVKIYGKKSGIVDNQSIVVDEVIGMWIAGAAAFTSIYLWIWAFLLFRFFDIRKPWPASFFDKKVKNCFGVIMDDVVAGFYALLGVSIFAININ